MANHSSSQLMSQPVNSYIQEAPLGFGQRNTSDVWLTQNNQYSSGHAPVQNSQKRSTRRDTFDKNASRSRDARSRDRDRNTLSNRSYREAPARPTQRPPTHRPPTHRPPTDWRDRPSKRKNEHSSSSHRRELRDPAPKDINPLDYSSLTNQRELYKVSSKPSPEVIGKHVVNPRPSRPRNRGNEDTKPKESNNRDLKEKTEPPAKRPREEAVNDLPKPKGNIKLPNPNYIPSRAVTWRAQLASAIAREIMSNPDNKTDLDSELVLIELKSTIRHRLATLVGTNYDMRINAMSELYKLHYNDDSHRELLTKITADMNQLKESHGPVEPNIGNL